MKTFTQDLIQLILIGCVAFAFGKANALERGDLAQAIKESQIELITLEIKYDLKTLGEIKTIETLTIAEEN